jgi:retron-type reverse transcriptase
MNKPKPKDKPFAIPKLLVWEAYRRVAANKGAPGVDGQALEEFEADLEGNLYKIWNRMSSGTWFPPPVRAVEIPKPHSPGTRVLGVPTIADRIAQTVAAMYLEPLVEPRFHHDSYGYRPGKSAHDALGALQHPAGTLVERDKGTPQGSAVTAPTQSQTSSSSGRFRGF